MALSPILSEVGSVKRQRESKIVNYLQDFIQSLEDEGKKINLNYITVTSVSVRCSQPLLFKNGMYYKYQ